MKELIRKIYSSVLRTLSKEHSRGMTWGDFQMRRESHPYWIDLARPEKNWLGGELIATVQKYSVAVEGAEVYVTPQNALSLLHALRDLGIAVMGCDHHYYVKAPKNELRALQKMLGSPRAKFPFVRQTSYRREVLLEALDGGFYAGDETLLGDDPVGSSASKLEKHVLDELPSNTAFVSLMLYIPPTWKLSDA